MPPAKASFATLGVGTRRFKIPQEISQTISIKPLSRARSSRCFSASRALPKKASRYADQKGAHAQGQREYRPKFPLSTHKASSSAAAGASAIDTASPAGPSPDEVSRAVALAILVRQSLLAHEAIPSEENVVEALRSCNNAARLVVDASTKPALRGTQTESATAASNLLSLDTNGARLTQPTRAEISGPPRAKDLIGSIADAAYQIIVHPPVVITPQVLELYVDIQAQLGRPETLPYVFNLYASKPKPQGRLGSIEYIEQNPNRSAGAVDSSVIEQALDTAIEAKHLDAAIGIIENTYATQAFIRAKLFKKALLPVSTLVVTPFAAYVLASKLALLQNSVDQKTATGVATIGIVAYVGFTAGMGVIAMATQNDHMKRVTWAPGTPLRDRWLQEDYRAALDKVACGFGFSESHRYGEEEGAEFQALREFILRKGMILDRVELMEGMQ